jgi:Fe-Mn family superoxide dismutase
MSNQQHYPFTLEPLPYGYGALEPYIDTLTMELHHDRHVKAYVDNLNAALKDHPEYQSWDLERLIKQANWLPEAMRTSIKNNAGGVYNHNFFFKNMTGEETRLSKILDNAISSAFGNFERFKESFTKAALGVFGSGYAWLTADCGGKLQIATSANQDTLLTRELRPIMCIDVWEHAYYLKHYNKRADYIADWFRVVNLDEASKNYGSR